jgi:hypothetical protein
MHAAIRARDLIGGPRRMGQSCDGLGLKSEGPKPGLRPPLRKEDNPGLHA